MPRSRRPPSPPAHSYGGRVPARLGPFLAVIVVFTLTLGPDTARPRASAAGGLRGPRRRRRAHRPDRHRLPHAAPRRAAGRRAAAGRRRWGAGVARRAAAGLPGLVVPAFRTRHPEVTLRVTVLPLTDP